MTDSYLYSIEPSASYEVLVTGVGSHQQRGYARHDTLSVSSVIEEVSSTHHQCLDKKYKTFCEKIADS